MATGGHETYTGPVQVTGGTAAGSVGLAALMALATGCGGEPGEPLPCPVTGCGDQPRLSATPGPSRPLAPTCTVTAGGLVLEAEAFLGPWKTGTTLPGFLGEGYLVPGSNEPADTAMSSTVTIPEAARYAVWTRGWTSPEADRRWRVTIDGSALEATHGATEDSGFVWQHAGDLELTGGPMEITITDAGTDRQVADAVVLATHPDFDPRADEACWRLIDPEEAAQMALGEIVDHAQSLADGWVAPTSVGELHARADELRQTVAGALGLSPLPTATPLNATIHGTTQLDGYRIERVTFESRPGFVVTANVYLPDGPGPFPLVVSPIGHWMTYGKAADTPARRAHGLAALGYATITYDPFGQGERAVDGNEHGQHWRLLLSGHTNAGLMVWDTMRAIDYMASRPDVDAKGAVITGASGGGLNSLYTSVLDPRIELSIPAVYVCQWEHFLATGLWHCGCSFVPNLGSATNMGELAGLLAPGPQLLLDALDDPMFTTEGAERAAAQARVAYELLQEPSHLRLQSFPGGHDYGQAMRETAYGFIRQHADGLGDGSPVAEPAAPPLWVNDPAYYCYGSTGLPDGTTTVRQLALTWAEEAAHALPSPAEVTNDQLRAALREQVRPPPESHGVAVPKAFAHTDDLEVALLRVQLDRGVTLPARFVSPTGAPPIVVVVDGSRDRLAGHDVLQRVQAAGLAAMHVSLRGQGELQWEEYEQLSANLLLGESLVGQRAFDLIQVRRAILKWLGGPARPVGLLALGDGAAFSALVAQALFDEYDAVALAPLSSTLFRAFSSEGVPLQMYVADLLHGADIPQVIALAAEHPLLVGLEDDEYLTRSPAWATLVQQKADLRDHVTQEVGLAWLTEQLCFAAPDSCATVPGHSR